MSYTNMRDFLLLEEVTSMRLLLVLGVCAAFITAILTAGYEGKPTTSKEN